MNPCKLGAGEKMQSFSDFLPDLVDIIGLVGVVIILWYYFLLQIGKCSSNSLIFSVANFVGAILILISLVFNWNLSSVVIEVAWLLISLYGVYHYYAQRSITKAEEGKKPSSSQGDLF